MFDAYALLLYYPLAAIALAGWIRHTRGMETAGRRVALRSLGFALLFASVAVGVHSAVVIAPWWMVFRQPSGTAFGMAVALLVGWGLVGALAFALLESRARILRAGGWSLLALVGAFIAFILTVGPLSEWWDRHSGQRERELDAYQARSHARLTQEFLASMTTEPAPPGLVQRADALHWVLDWPPTRGRLYVLPPVTQTGSLRLSLRAPDAAARDRLVVIHPGWQRNFDLNPAMGVLEQQVPVQAGDILVVAQAGEYDGVEVSPEAGVAPGEAPAPADPAERADAPPP